MMLLLLYLSINTHKIVYFHQLNYMFLLLFLSRIHIDINKNYLIVLMLLNDQKFDQYDLYLLFYTHKIWYDHFLNQTHLLMLYYHNHTNISILFFSYLLAYNMVNLLLLQAGSQNANLLNLIFSKYSRPLKYFKGFGRYFN